jgi:TetR/AcrR family transcriptional regulator, cholesterol catabolism regulator
MSRETTAPMEARRHTPIRAKSPAPRVSTKSRIDNGAAQLFVRNGYDGTSMRDLARNLGLRPSSIYGHVKSKQELLFRVMERLMDEVLARANEALKADGEPQELVRRLVVSNICQPGPYETALLQSELRNLRPSYRASIARKQTEYRDLWLRVLNDGRKRGVFNIKDPKLAFLGIDGALIHIERWFNPSGRLTRMEVAEVFVDWILNSLGFRQPAKGRSGGIGNAKRTRLRR